MVEPLSGLVEGEMAEVVWIISEADVREMLGRSGFLYGEVLTCLLKNPARQLCIYRNCRAGQPGTVECAAYTGEMPSDRTRGS